MEFIVIDWAALFVSGTCVVQLEVPFGALAGTLLVYTYAPFGNPCTHQIIISYDLMGLCYLPRLVQHTDGHGSCPQAIKIVEKYTQKKVLPSPIKQ